VVVILSKLRGLLERKPDQGERLYGSIVAAARRPEFYLRHGVPDTVDGRFDLIVVHMFLVLERLKGEAHADLRQALTDTFFKDMDRSLREMGTGDLSVGKKVRKMAEAFFGRIKAYGEAGNVDALSEAVARNVYAELDTTPAPALAQYMVLARQRLSAQDEADIISGQFKLPDV
jgi:cytochrome b pre-mRNA-processing protein 3